MKTVKELNKDELEILKQKLYYMSEEDLAEEFKEVLNDDLFSDITGATFWGDIKDETVFTLYDGISFVEEDFFSDTKSEDNAEQKSKEQLEQLKNLFKTDQENITKEELDQLVKERKNSGTETYDQYESEDFGKTFKYIATVETDDIESYMSNEAENLGDEYLYDSETLEIYNDCGDEVYKFVPHIVLYSKE